jgi:tetratricopeptide (TPR) repeat protein
MNDETIYSIKDVAELLGLGEARLRYWAQTGFVSPSVRRKGRFFYTFQDLVGVKVAQSLVDSGVSLQRVRKNLDALRKLLPQVDRPLAQLRICSDGDELVVIDDEGAFEPASGQVVMSLALRSLAPAQIIPFPAPVQASAPVAAVPTSAPATAYSAFLAAVRADEAGDDTTAEHLYRRSLALDPSFAAAWTNMGNILERRGERGQARTAYEKALALDPEQPEARFNLANLHADLDEVDLALAEYRRVAGAMPEFPDVHFNMAVLLARIGAAKQARTHLNRYLELDRTSRGEWRSRATALLRSLPASS